MDFGWTGAGQRDSFVGLKLAKSRTLISTIHAAASGHKLCVILRRYDARDFSDEEVGVFISQMDHMKLISSEWLDVYAAAPPGSTLKEALQKRVREIMSA